MLISLINTWDAILAFHGHRGLRLRPGQRDPGGSTWSCSGRTPLSCHSCRHIIGGRLKHFSKHPVRYRAWTFVSKLNTRHMELAWITLATLALTDFYIMALAADWFSDLRFIN